jgi:hypothetical protein
VPPGQDSFGFLHRGSHKVLSASLPKGKPGKTKRLPNAKGFWKAFNTLLAVPQCTDDRSPILVGIPSHIHEESHYVSMRRSFTLEYNKPAIFVFDKKQIEI